MKNTINGLVTYTDGKTLFRVGERGNPGASIRFRTFKKPINLPDWYPFESRALPWRDDAGQAEDDLRKYAERRGLVEIDEVYESRVRYYVARLEGRYQIFARTVGEAQGHRCGVPFPSYAAALDDLRGICSDYPEVTGLQDICCGTCVHSEDFRLIGGPVYCSRGKGSAPLSRKDWICPNWASVDGEARK